MTRMQGIRSKKMTHKPPIYVTFKSMLKIGLLNQRLIQFKKFL